MRRVNKAYRYRLYPTADQKAMFAKTFGCARFIYNKMLGDRISYYRETGKKLHNTPAQYKSEFPWLREVDSLALAISNPKGPDITPIPPTTRKVLSALRMAGSNFPGLAG